MPADPPTDISMNNPPTVDGIIDNVDGIAAETPDRCALDGCDLPLPPRLLDENGRPRGGRRPQYCGKPHTDAASRQRRARDAASVDDPLSLLRAGGEALLPEARQLSARLTDLITRFDQAEAGALARVVAAEQETAEAVAEANSAAASAESAEQARRQALALARQDRQARDNAIREAERVTQESEVVRTRAWEQVAAHERGRGQAEADSAAARAAADALQAQNRQLREQIEHARAALGDLTAQLAEADREHERLRGEARTATARLSEVERYTGQENHRLLEQNSANQGKITALSAIVTDLQMQLATERSTSQARADEASRLRDQLSAAARQQRRLQLTLNAARADAATARAEAAAAEAEIARAEIARAEAAVVAHRHDDQGVGSD